MKTWTLTRLLAVAVLGGTACGDIGDPAGAMSDAELNARLQTLDHDLTEGARGVDAAAVNAYLARYGYLPNERLAKLYPRWRPLVDRAPSDATVFDGTTKAALRTFQSYMGLAPSGAVDEATRALLKQPRCSVPEGIAPLDPSDKFALHGTVYPRGGKVGWQLDARPPGLTFEAAKDAIRRASDSWRNATDLNLRGDVFADEVNIHIGLMSGPDIFFNPGALGLGFYPQDGSAIRILGSNEWSASINAPPAGKFDYESVILHEMGHALGIEHSSVQAGNVTAVMYPTIGAGQVVRTLTLDDKSAISALYDTWEWKDGCVLDVAAGDAGTAWVTECGPGDAAGNRAVWKFTEARTWVRDATGMAGVRMAISAGFPIVVKADGSVFSRSSKDPFSGSWGQIPGCVTDIASNGTALWALGCVTNSAGFRVQRWVTSGWVVASGGGVSIGVDRFDRPWVTNNAQKIVRKKSAVPDSGLWEFYPGAARDIAFGRSTAATGVPAPYVIGTIDQGNGNFSIHMLNEQSGLVLNPDVGFFEDPETNAPQRQGSIQIPGGAVRVSVGDDGAAWVVDAQSNLWRSFR